MYYLESNAAFSVFPILGKRGRVLVPFKMKRNKNIKKNEKKKKGTKRSATAAELLRVSHTHEAHVLALIETRYNNVKARPAGQHNHILFGHHIFIF